MQTLLSHIKPLQQRGPNSEQYAPWSAHGGGGGGRIVTPVKNRTEIKFEWTHFSIKIKAIAEYNHFFILLTLLPDSIQKPPIQSKGLQHFSNREQLSPFCLQGSVFNKKA